MPNSWASSSVGASIIVSASSWNISFGETLKLRPVTIRRMPLWVDTASMQLLAALARSADHDSWHHCPFWAQVFLVFDQKQPGATGLSLRRVTCGFTCVTHG